MSDIYDLDEARRRAGREAPRAGPPTPRETFEGSDGSDGGPPPVVTGRKPAEGHVGMGTGETFVARSRLTEAELARRSAEAELVSLRVALVTDAAEAITAIDKARKIAAALANRCGHLNGGAASDRTAIRADLRRVDAALLEAYNRVAAIGGKRPLPPTRGGAA